jgi:regulator of protease activity HflC (stomatin/prohibitin superfamily)
MQTIDQKKLKERFGNLTMSLQIFFLIVLLLLIFLIPKMYVAILPGEAGVFWDRFFSGTDITHPYPEGSHFFLPWNKMYVYNIRLRAREHELEVLSREGLNVHLYLSIRFRPQHRYLGLLHQNIGPNYAEVIIIPEVTNVLRETIGKMAAEDIYTTGRKVITIAINEAIEQVARRYIYMDDVLIKQIDLPPVVAEAIKFEIKQKHLVEAHKFIRDKEMIEAERKRIEAEGIRDYLAIVASALPNKEDILIWRGIEATENLAKSNNSKIVLIGAGREGLPLILNVDSMQGNALPSTQSQNNNKDKSVLSQKPLLNPEKNTSVGIKKQQE